MCRRASRTPHGLTPTAKCCRRVRGFPGFPAKSPPGSRASPTPSIGNILYIMPENRATRPVRRSYHSPLEGESQKSSRMAKASAVGGQRRGRHRGRPHPKALRSRTSPSRMAKACAEGGSHKASQRRDLVRRDGSHKVTRQAKADAEGGRRGVARVPSPQSIRRGANATPRGSQPFPAVNPAY